MPDCEYYDGCRGDATHIARLLENYERMVDVPVCESCVSEILETTPADRVRELSVRDRMQAALEDSE
ncbi:hypothetical protein C489_06038 [Natrinema versiforme JCM 10478]|uniref:Uncharacterized protein n=2 Tax=Natrinema versiforme TaxID=88724 RepID=L9Y7I6_9EURY|nr:hypothetical protein C489_06038 [Natrinema versiforme JCM 10478]